MQKERRDEPRLAGAARGGADNQYRDYVRWNDLINIYRKRQGTGRA